LLASIEIPATVIKKIVPKAASKFCSDFPYLSLVDFLKFISLRSISEQFSESKAAFGTILSEGFIELVKD
jgi:hypothetical protein